MSLDIDLYAMRKVSVFETNITHNLTKMADEAGIYKHLWRPEEIGIKTASELIEPLHAALTAMRTDPARFRAHNPLNGWGDYDVFVQAASDYLRACIENPDAEIQVSR